MAEDDDEAEPPTALGSSVWTPDGLRAPVVEVLDDVAVVAPPPGTTVTVEVLYDDGQTELVDVSTDDVGGVAVRYRDDERDLVPRSAPAGVCPNECADTRSAFLGGRWTGALEWSYRDAARPRRVNKAAAIRALHDGASAIPQGRNACGLPDEVSASHVYLGETVVAPNIGVVGNAVSCMAQDDQSVVAWSDLPGSFLGYACLWWQSGGAALSADIVFDASHAWYTGDTAPLGCKHQFSLRGVATHEFGHVFGLGHTSGDSCNLTMHPSTTPCNDGQRVLGLGDVMGLESLY